MRVESYARLTVARSFGAIGPKSAHPNGAPIHRSAVFTEGRPLLSDRPSANTEPHSSIHSGSQSPSGSRRLIRATCNPVVASAERYRFQPTLLPLPSQDASRSTFSSGG